MNDGVDVNTVITESQLIFSNTSEGFDLELTCSNKAEISSTMMYRIEPGTPPTGEDTPSHTGDKLSHTGDKPSHTGDTPSHTGDNPLFGHYSIMTLFMQVMGRLCPVLHPLFCLTVSVVWCLRDPQLG